MSKYELPSYKRFVICKMMSNTLTKKDTVSYAMWYNITWHSAVIRTTTVRAVSASLLLNILYISFSNNIWLILSIEVVHSDYCETEAVLSGKLFLKLNVQFKKDFLRKCLAFDFTKWVLFFSICFFSKFEFNIHTFFFLKNHIWHVPWHEYFA